MGPIARARARARTRPRTIVVREQWSYREDINTTRTTEESVRGSDSGAYGVPTPRDPGPGTRLILPVSARRKRLNADLDAELAERRSEWKKSNGRTLRATCGGQLVVAIDARSSWELEKEREREREGERCVSRTLGTLIVHNGWNKTQSCLVDFAASNNVDTFLPLIPLPYPRVSHVPMCIAPARTPSIIS